MSPPQDRRGVLGPACVATAVLLTLLTVLNFFVLERYVADGDSVSILPPAGLSLSNDDPSAIVRHDIAIPLDPGFRFLALEAEAEGFGIQGGNRPWHRGRIVLLRQRADGSIIWELPHVLALLKGDPVRWRFREIFTGDGETASLAARLELLKATGRLEVFSLTATPMRENHGFRPVANLLLAGWILLAVALTCWAWRRTRERRRLIGLAWLVAAPALALSVMPGTVTSPARTIASEAVDLVSAESASPQEREAAISANHFSIAKTGHVLMFFAAGFAFGLARGRSGWLSVWVLAVLFAGLAEMLQLYSPNRAPSGFDLSINIASATVGVWLGMTALWWSLRTAGRRSARPCPDRSG